jgi:hypothetical protein
MLLDYNTNGNYYPNPEDNFEDENIVECFQCGELFDCEGYVEVECCSPECEAEYKECEKEFRNDLKNNR